MWHSQGEWVTCRQFSILIFQYKSLVHLKCYILIQIPSQSDMWFLRYEQFFNFKHNVKHKNLSPLLACNSKSIFPTSDSFPLTMSHILYTSGTKLSQHFQGPFRPLGLNILQTLTKFWGANYWPKGPPCLDPWHLIQCQQAGTTLAPSLHFNKVWLDVLLMWM